MKLKISLSNCNNLDSLVQDEKLDQQPVFLAHQGVSGKVMITSLGSTETMTGITLEIRLLGIVKTSLTWQEVSLVPADGRNMGYNKKVLDLSRQYRLRQSSLDASTQAASCRFHLPLASATSTRIEVLADGEMKSCAHPWEQLPSSLEQKSSISTDWKSSMPHCYAAVTYFVHATARRNNRKLVAASRQVQIFVPNSVEPPLSLEDFGQEYKSHEESTVRRKLFPRVGSMLIQSMQPNPFIFSARNNLATTQVVLQVKLRFTGGTLKNDSIGALSADITWSMRSYTFICMQAQKASPTTRQATTSPSLGQIVKDGPSHRMKMLWSTWRKSQSLDSKYCEWIASYPIALSCQFSPSMPPTFALPHLSHRYSLLLDFDISGPYRSKASLRLPVQVVYQAKAMETPVLTGSERECTLDLAAMHPANARDVRDVVLPPYGA